MSSAPIAEVDGARRERKGLRGYRLFQRENSLEVRQRFIVGPDDE